MKKILSLILALVATTCLWAYDFQYGELIYKITCSYEPYTVEVYHANLSITSVIIPETVTYEGTTYSVTSIGDDAFWICSSLTSVTIPNSVTSIGDRAFHGCSALTSVTIPNSVMSIGRWAFYGCSALTSVIIPNSVTSIGDYAFSGCDSLTSMVVENGNTTYDSRENCNAIIETATNTLIAGCQNTIIPNSVTSIGDGAFEGCSALTSVTIPNSVTSIGQGALYKCSSLTSVTIGNSVTSIGDAAFGGCSSLTSVTIPNSVTSIGERAFIQCSNLTSVTISNSVASIGEWAFARCSSLTSVTIPNSVASIGEWAFAYCSSLTSITIPNSVTSIGHWAFSDCSALTSIVVESGNSTYDSRENCNAIIETATNTLIAGCQKTIIPNSVTSIEEWAFYDCESLTSVTIPNSVTSIGDRAFLGCLSLKTVICEAIEVPELLGSDVFYDMPLSEATLYVPAQSLDDYKAAEQWKEFGTILPLDKAPSAVENTRLPITNSIKLLRNGQVYVLQDGKTYTITGQRL